VYIELDKENKIVTTNTRYTTLHEDFPIQGKKTRSTMERSKVGLLASILRLSFVQYIIF